MIDANRLMFDGIVKSTYLLQTATGFEWFLAPMHLLNNKMPNWIWLQHSIEVTISSVSAAQYVCFILSFNGAINLLAFRIIYACDTITCQLIWPDLMFYESIVSTLANDVSIQWLFLRSISVCRRLVFDLKCFEQVCMAMIWKRLHKFQSVNDY